MGITVGIDLGTTNSVNCVKKIDVSVLCNAEGDELTPSCVTAIPKTEGDSYDVIVGRHARDLLQQYPEQTILSVKRLMGRQFDEPDVQQFIQAHQAHKYNYQVITDPSEPGSIRIPLAGKMQTPEMISGLILKKLIQDGESVLGDKIEQGVVTVPAYFSDGQKFATRAACDYAGIKLLQLLPEPTAAALSFGLKLDEQDSRTVMVFDLGGGTFDISILSIAKGSFMEVTKGGDMWLGGDNIDQLLIEHIFATAQEDAGIESIHALIEQHSSDDRIRFLTEVAEKAEQAKIALSSEEQVNVEIFGLLKDNNQNLVDIDVTISRTDFDKLLEPTVSKILSITERILHEIRFEPELIDTVLMVGGSSYIPVIQAALKELFGAEKVMMHPRPMLAVAEGAAVMASKLAAKDDSNERNALTIMHSTAHDYYLQLADGKRHLLIARNTPLPVTVEEKLSFSQKDQLLARLRVFNDVEGVLETVGELWFHKENYNPHENSGRPTELMLQFSVDEDNIIEMKARALDSETPTEAKIARGGLAAKLYHDLEQALSSIVANSDRDSVVEDILRLSRQVVETILLTTDPITGEICPAQKQKAQHQIDTLKGCQEKNLSPLRGYEFAASLASVASDVLSKGEQAQLTSLLNKFRAGLESLEDVELLQQLEDELESFYEEVPLAYELADANEAALFLQSTDSAGDAKQIRRKITKINEHGRHKRNDLMENEREALQGFISSKLSWGSDTQSRRFDRDVVI